MGIRDRKLFQSHSKALGDKREIHAVFVICSGSFSES